MSAVLNLTDPRPQGYTPVPLPGVSNWVSAAAFCGFSFEAVLKDHGLELDLTQPTGIMVPPLEMLEVMQTCVARSQRHYFPFALGEGFVFDGQQYLEAYLATSPTLRQAMQVWPWLRTLLFPWLSVRLEEVGDDAYLIVKIDHELGDHPGAIYFIDTVLASLRKFGLYLLGDRLQGFSTRLKLIQFARTQPDNARQISDYFPCPVVFGAHHNAFVLPISVMDQTLAGSFPALNGQARQQIEQEVEAADSRFSTANAVRRTLTEQPGLLRGSLETVAEAMGIHVRTLQRRLQADGVRFADLLSEAKHEEARRLLARRGLSLEAISEQLGFSDRRAFTCAFKRWAGTSPSIYRSNLFETPMRRV